MWFECSRLLSLGLRKYREKANLPDTLTRLFLEWEREPILQRPRPPVTALLGSPVAFSIGKEFLVVGGKSPERFAEELVPIINQLANESRGGQGITFSVESGGFLNVQFPDQTALELLTRLLGDERISNEKIGSEKKSSGKIFDFSSVFTEHDETSFPSRPYRFPNVDTEVRSRVAALKDEAADKLLALPDTSELRLMLLSVLADEELDASVYLSGLSGIQNIPWLLERFRRDLTKLLSASNDFCSAEREGYEKSFYAQPADRLSQRFVVEVGQKCAWARLEFASAARRKKPEEFLRFLIEIARLFYSFYNRPDFRRELLALPSEGPQIWMLVQFLDKLLNESRFALESIEV